jgi:hypothetical protein
LGAISIREEGGYPLDVRLFLLDRLLRMGFVLSEQARAGGFFDHPEDLLQADFPFGRAYWS